jgi:hypothetical protein
VARRGALQSRSSRSQNVTGPVGALHARDELRDRSGLIFLQVSIAEHGMGLSKTHRAGPYFYDWRVQR